MVGAAGGGAAAVAALLFATFPEIWRSTSYLLTELPFALFYTAAVLLFHHGLHTDRRSFLFAWPCFALATMTRYTAVLFGLTAVLLCLLPLLSRDRQALARMRSPHFVLGPALAAAMLAPLLVRAWWEFGDPLIGFAAASRQLPDYSRHARMPVLYYVTNLPAMIGWLAALALPAATADGWARRQRLVMSCSVAAFVIIAWMSRYGWKEPRLVSASLPFVAVIVGLGFGRLWSWMRAERAQQLLLAAATLAFVAAVQIDPGYARARREIAHSVTLGYPSFATAMRQLRATTPPSTVLMGPNCYQIAWYADRACRPMPGDDRSDTDAGQLQAALPDVDYLVVTSFERGQPGYAADVAARAERLVPDAVATYRDARFWTKVIAAGALARIGTRDGQDGGEAPGAGPDS